MNSYKGVIFDFNGTLFFDNPKHVLAWGKISEEIRHHGISEEQCTDEQKQKYSLLKEQYYREFCKEDKETFHLVAGATEFFDKLKNNNIPFTIASASIKPNIDFFVESFHLDHWINPDDIVYDDGTYENKIIMFKKAAHILGLEVSDCLIIEDSLSGIENAYKAGCRNIIVIDSANKKDEYQKLPGVTKVIDTFKEI